MAMSDSLSTPNAGSDHDLLIRIDEQLRQFLGVQRDHTTKLGEHDKKLGEHDVKLEASISLKQLLVGLASSVAAASALTQVIDWVMKK
jgi:hypothetical protein